MSFGLKPPSKLPGKGSHIAKPSATLASSTKNLAASATNLASNNSTTVPGATVNTKKTQNGEKDGDEFIIGDRIFVGGTKPGVIAYIGETQFAAGDWAGVVLDDPDGKNDGSVQGVRYFQCEPKRGVFSRPSKLTRHRVEEEEVLMPAPPSPQPSVTKESSDEPITTTPKIPKTEERRESLVPAGTRGGLPKRNGSISASNTSLSSAALATVGAKHIKIGDRVVVNGTKLGVLRYLGTTEFAPGEWAGVELDDENGKNDGSVAGKRYFECKPLFGLFAPVHKVTKQGVAPSPSGGRTTPSVTQQKASMQRLSSSASIQGLNSKSKDLSNSQESLVSLGSAVSAASRSRLQPSTAANATAAANRVALARQAYKSISTNAGTTAALQKALKEKEEHIEQLIRERELERSETFKTSLQKEEDSGRVNELEETLSKLQADVEASTLDAEFRVNELQAKVDILQDEKQQLEASLAEQTAKLEDLQFQIEEEAITRSDQQACESSSSETIAELNKDLNEERLHKSELQAKLTELQEKLEYQANELAALHQQISTTQQQSEEYKVNCNLLEKQLSMQKDENSKFNEKVIELQKQLEKKSKDTAEQVVQNTNFEARVQELQSELNTVKAEASTKVSHANAKVQELLSELNTVKAEASQQTENLSGQLNDALQSVQKLTNQVQGVQKDLTSALEEKTNTAAELKEIKLQMSDLQRLLDSGESAKALLADEKAKLEQQMDALMKNSGDSSKQLVLLNDEIREKDRKVEALHQTVSEVTSAKEKLKELLDNAMEAHSKEADVLKSQNEKVVGQLQEEIKEKAIKITQQEQQFQAKIENVTAEKTLWQQKYSEMESALRSEREEKETIISTQKESIAQLEVKLNKEKTNSESYSAELESSREQLTKLLSEKSSSEKELAELRSDGERFKIELQKAADSLKSNLEGVQKQLADSQAKLLAAEEAAASSEQKLILITEEKEKILTQNNLLVRQYEELQSKSDSLQSQSNMEIVKLTVLRDDLQTMLDTQKKETEDKIFELEEQIVITKAELEAANSKVQNYTAERLSLSDEIESIKKDLSSSNHQRSKALAEVDSHKVKVKFLEEERENLNRKVTSLEEENSQNSEQINNLIHHSNEYQKKIKSYEKDLEKVRKSAQLSEQTFFEEMEAKNRELELHKLLVEKHTEEIKHLKSQVALSATDTETIRQLRERLLQTENERDDFKKEVEDFEFKFEELQNSEGVRAVHDKDEKTTDTYHVDFLNSVIVDQKKKIDELTNKIKLLAEINDHSPDQNGYGDPDLSTSLAESGRSRPPPRLFCDICDIFDAHDTDDCPIQAQDEEGPPASHYHEDRHMSRPYCETCEVFGHTTEDCDQPDEW